MEIVGKGTGNSARSNARTLDWSGNEVLAGKLTVGTSPTANMDVTTKQYVDNATSSHTHGNITNGGDITTSATIENGDRLIINDESASKITNSFITFGTSTSQYLANNGTWQNVPTVPTKTSDLTNDSGFITSTTADSTYVPKSLNGNSITYSSSSAVKAITIKSQNLSPVSLSLESGMSGETAATISAGDSTLTVASTGAYQSGTYITINSDATTINGVVTPTADGMAANKKYVDDSISGLSDATWNGVTLNKNENLGGAPYYVPAMATTSATGAYMMQATYTPTANKLAIYDSSSYLKSTTPSANDNSTKVATTAYVDAAITAAIGAAIGGSY